MTVEILFLRRVLVNMLFIYEQMKTILVPVVHIHIYSVQNKDGRNQEQASAVCTFCFYTFID